MGLDLHAGSGSSELTWHASYSGFARVRDALAEAAGINRHDHYRDRFSMYSLCGYWIDPKDFTARSIGDHSFERVEDPLDYLMLHSDCEGILPAFAARKLADRIDGLLPKIKDDYRREHIELLASFLREAGDEGEMVHFC